MTARYVKVPAARMEAALETIGLRVRDEVGGDFRWCIQGRERVFDLTFASRVHCPGSDVTIRVFTSLANGAGSARACGNDAVRIVLGRRRDGVFRPIEKGRKLLRTAPASDDEDARVTAFLERLTEALREAYGKGKRLPQCGACGSVMTIRVAGDHEFWGCTKFPDCRHTMIGEVL